MKYHIIDYNPSATTIFPVLNESVMGIDVRQVLGEYEEMIFSILNSVEHQCTVDHTNGTYKVNSVKILESNDIHIGYIVELVDITKYINIMEELNYLAARDVLTGAYNRRKFNELSSKELEEARINHHSISMMILDIDYFKKVNDNYGHQAGDEVLKRIVAICHNSIQASDILGRYGGEEFVIFLPNTTLIDCQVVSNRILLNIEAEEIFYEGKCIRVTVSLGVVNIKEVKNENLECILRNADKALYLAKSEGRNCIRYILDVE